MNTSAQQANALRSTKTHSRWPLQRVLLPAGLYEPLVAWNQLRQGAVLPFWGVGHGGAHQTLTGGDLMQQSMVIQAIIWLPSCP